MKRKINAGSTSFLERVFIRDCSVFTKVKGLTGLVFNTLNLTCYYIRAGAASDTAVTLATATVGTWATGGFKEIDATNMPGWYEFSVPNAAVAAGATSVAIHFRGAANMEDTPIQYELDAVNYQDATAFGLSRLDAAVSSRMATFTRTIANGTGTATAGAGSTITLQTDIGDGSGVGGVIEITGGTGVGQMRGVSSYAFATKILTVARPWVRNPDATSTYAIYPGEYAALDASLRPTALSVINTVTANVNGFGAAGYAAMLKLMNQVPNLGTVWVIDPVNGSSGGTGGWTGAYDTLVSWYNNAGWVSGDTVFMLPGTQVWGNNVVTMPAGISVVGVNRKACVITSTAVLTSLGAIFSPGSGTVNHGFTITALSVQPASPGIPVFQACLGAYGSTQGCANALVYDVDLIGGTDCIYLDAGRATTKMPIVLSINGTPAGGTFTVTVGANTTAGIAYNASAATIQTAITGLASVGASKATVSTSGTTAFLVNFAGSVAEANVSSSGASLTGGTSPTAKTTGTCNLSVRDARFNSGWDFVAVENAFSGSNSNGNVTLDNTLYLDNFEAYCTGVSAYLPEPGSVSFGVNVINEWIALGGALSAQRGTVACYLKNGYISTTTADPGVNSYALSVGGPLAILDVQNVEIVQRNTGSGGVIQDVHAVGNAQGATLVTLNNVAFKYSTRSIDANSTLVLCSPLGDDSGWPKASVADYATGKVPLQPTVAGNTLDVSATGEAGLDFANIKDATGAHTLTNITVPTVTTLTNLPSIPANWITAAGINAGALNAAVWGILLSDPVFVGDPNTIGSGIASMMEVDPGHIAKERLTALALANVPTGALSGPSSVTLTFHDSLGVAVPNVIFSILGQGSAQANSFGVAAFGLPNGTYTVVANPTGTVLFSNTTLTVSGTTARTITGHSANIPTPPSPGQTTAYGVTRDPHGNPIGGVVVTLQLRNSGQADVYDGGTFTSTSDSSGNLEIILLKSRAYRIKTASGKYEEFTTSSDDTQPLPSVLGGFTA